MIIVYDSMTGNTKRFVERLPFPTIQVSEGLLVNEDYVLITYTTGFGQVPDSTTKFLANNFNHIKGVASSGNRNWGQNFGKSADLIGFMFGVPILLKFELAGTAEDTTKFIERVHKLVKTY